MVGYNPQRHKTLFGAAVFGHNVTDGEPIQGHTDFLGVLRIIANVMFFIVLFIGGVKFFEWNDKRKERNELRRSAEKKGMMNDTDPAPTGSDDIELTAVQDVPMASSVPAASSEHEEQGLRPDGSDGGVRARQIAYGSLCRRLHAAWLDHWRRSFPPSHEAGDADRAGGHVGEPCRSL